MKNNSFIPIFLRKGFALENDIFLLEYAML